MSYKPANLLVTGGAGFIGSNFVHYWLRQYPECNIVVLDALTYAGNRNNIIQLEAGNNFTFVQGNICNTELVTTLLIENNIDTIVNFAAESHVDRSIVNPDAFIETNIIGTHSLLKAAKYVWLDSPKTKGLTTPAHRFHHISTDEVYGALKTNEPSFTENTPYAPNSPYSASKAASDHLVRAYHHTYKLSTTISHCSNNYGPYHFPEKLIPLAITNILQNKSIPVYGDGKHIRDWIYVEDHVRGIDLILRNGLPGERYNIGGHNEMHNIDIIMLICKKLAAAFSENSHLTEQYPQAISAINGDCTPLVQYVTDRAGHDRRYAVNSEKSRIAFNYMPKESFETGITKTIDWYLNHSSWWIDVKNTNTVQP